MRLPAWTWPAPPRSERSACELRHSTWCRAPGGCRRGTVPRPTESSTRSRSARSTSPEGDLAAGSRQICRIRRLVNVLDGRRRSSASGPVSVMAELASGSTTTRSKRSGSPGTIRFPPGRRRRARGARTRRDAGARAFDGRPSPRATRNRAVRASGPRRTTSVERRPGIDRDEVDLLRDRRGRSSRARASPAAIRCAATLASARSPACCAAVRIRERWQASRIARSPAGSVATTARSSAGHPPVTRWRPASCPPVA